MRAPGRHRWVGDHQRGPVVVWSAVYLLIGVAGSIVAITGDLPGTPFGIEPGFSSAQGVALGWGSAVSAPWPLLAWLAVSGILGRGPRWSVPALATLFLIGALGEPVWDLAAGSEGVLLAGIVWGNLLVPIALLVSWVTTRTATSARNDPVTAP